MEQMSANRCFAGQPTPNGIGSLLEVGSYGFAFKMNQR